MNLNIEYRIIGRPSKKCETIDQLISDVDYNTIQWLHIQDIKFTKEFILPSQLNTIYLVNCKNTEHIGKLPNTLEYINMGGCNCFSMDHWFQNDLPNLHSIHLKMNRLNKVPIIPQNVISLDISNNSIKKLPNENCFPKQIQNIDLSNNLLEELPNWFLDLDPDLQINLNGNKFWFSHYHDISLNRTIDIQLIRLVDRFFNPTITSKLLNIMKKNDEYHAFILEHPEYAIIVETVKQRKTNSFTHPGLEELPHLQRNNELPVLNHNVRPPINRRYQDLTQPEIDYDILRQPIQPFDRMLTQRNQRQRPAKKTTGEQGQNVHNSSIQDSFSQCVNILMKSNEPKNENYMRRVYLYYILDGINITENLRFINHLRYMCLVETAIVSRCGVTYGEIFERIWAITSTHPHRREMRKILREDVWGARNVCFTGKVTKLVNSMSGFIEGISIGYSNNEQINNRVIMIMREYEDKPDKIKGKVKEALDELNVPEDKQMDWLNQFD